MSGKTVKLYELCAKDEKRLYSPETWRIHLACLHKGLKVETIPCRYTEKEKLEFANSTTVPVLVDGDTVMRESWDIAVYLEKTYPDAAPLFGGKGGEATIRFLNNFANSIMMYYFPAVTLDLVGKLDEKNALYFREKKEPLLGGKLEEISQGSEGMVRKFREALEPLRMTLKEQKYIGGDEPNYGDFCIASIIMTSKAMSKLEILEKDDTVLQWFYRILQNFEDALEGFLWEW